MGKQRGLGIGVNVEGVGENWGQYNQRTVYDILKELIKYYIKIYFKSYGGT